MRIELPVVSIVSALLVLFPLPWHWRTRNVCTIAIILWLAACNIYGAINTIIWNDNVDIKYKIWCDIAVRIEVGGNVGIPASIVCICRRLAHACSPSHKALCAEDKRRRMKFEVGMCVVLPIISIALYAIVQIYRFNLVEGLGCFPTRSRSFPALLIVDIPPFLLSLISLVYAGVALRWLIHRRAQFLQTSSPAPSVPFSGRYLRIVALTIAQMTFAMVMTLLLIMMSIQNGVTPWVSWEYVHENWHEIHTTTKDMISDLNWASFKLTRYFVPIASVNTFAYFGFDDRVLSDYKSAFACVKRRVPCIRNKQDVALPLSSIDFPDARERPQITMVLVGTSGKDNTPTFDPSRGGG